MALRTIFKEGDDVLYKKSREVEVFDQKLWSILDDMAETMYESNGVGLAAPQIGMLKRIALVDIGDDLFELINPKITHSSDELDTDLEGCLSCPGEYGYLERPITIAVEYFDRNGTPQSIIANDFLARAFCHELDHLDGILFKQKVIRMADPDELDEHQDKKKKRRSIK
ncbi:MAG: peptide deformylase [Oscillospiraceae bacterium]